MKMRPALFLALAFALFGPALPARAEGVEGSPSYIDYQGTVYDSVGKPYGSTGTSPSFTAAPENKTMEFRIYDAQTGGTLIWAETQTVTVSLGAFAVRLGSGAQITAPTTLAHPALNLAFNGKERYLELTVITPGLPASPIIPRLAFQTSPFSFIAEHAKTADSVTGVVTATAGSTFNDGTFKGTFTAATDSAFTFIGGTFTGGTFTGAVTATSGTFTGVVKAATSSTFTGGTFTGGTFTGGTFTNADFSGSSKFGPINCQFLEITHASPYIDFHAGSTTTDKTARIIHGSTSGPLEFEAPGFHFKTGSVGIGTQSPTVPLQVFGLKRVTMTKEPGNYGIDVYTNNGNVEKGATFAEADLSILASGGVGALYFAAASDRRIKTDIAGSVIAEDLAVIQQLKVSNYRMVDPGSDGRGWRKGLIAQEVEQVIPGAVSRSTRFVPDIFSVATRVVFDAAAKTLAVAVARDHGLQAGERVRLHVDGTALDFTVSAVTSARGFVVDQCEQAPAKVFVYGREVDDFLAVDYDRVFITAVGALQELKLEQDAENKALQEENAVLKAALASQDKRVAALEAQNEARDAKMASIEKLLGSPEQSVARTISLKKGE